MIYKDIDFKLYVSAIMYGHQMSDKVKDISLFIIRLPYTYNYMSQDTTTDDNLMEQQSSYTIKKDMITYERETMIDPHAI